MSRKPFNPSIVFVIIGLLFIAIIGLRTISTPEIWTHLAQGKDGAPLSFVATDHAVNTTHLYDKLAYSAWNVGGARLLVLLNVAGLLSTFILLLPVARKWGGPLSQGFALLMAGHLMFQSLDTGPQVVMMLFIALFLNLLTTVQKPAILFAALIPLQVLWTNMHDSFLWGPILAALMGVQLRQAAKAAGRRKTMDVQGGTLFVLAAVLFAATLANPHLFKLHAQVIANIKSPAPVYWSSLFTDYFQIPALKPLIFFSMLLGAGGLITLKKRLPFALTTIAIIGAFLVWTSVRSALLFAVLSFPFMVLSFTAISEYLRGSLGSVLGKQDKLLGPATQTVFVLLVVLSIVPVVGNCAYVDTGSASNFGLGIEESPFPAGAEAILNHPAFPEKALNLPADGGYLAFHYGRKIFVDFRPGRYSRELLANLDGMLVGDPKAYDDLYEAYRPEAIIINTLEPNAAQGIVTLLARRLWKLAYFDGSTAILLADKEKFAPIFADKQIQQAGLDNLEKARAEYAAKVGKPCRAGNPPVLIGSGKVFLAFNRPVEAKAIFSLLLQGNHRIPGAWIGLGNSQMLLKEFDAAMASLKTATEMAPNNWLAWASYAAACKRAGNNEAFEEAAAKARLIAERNQKARKAEPTPVEEAAPAPKDVPLEEMAIPEK